MGRPRVMGSPLWFWMGVFILALVTFMCSGSFTYFIRKGSISVLPIAGFAIVVVPLLLVGILCVKRGRGNAYSFMADLLPILLIALLFGLAPLIPLMLWSVVPPLALCLLPIYYLHRRALRKRGAIDIPRSKRNRRIIELNCSFDEAFNLCISSLSTIRGGVKAIDKDRDRGIIIAKTGRTWSSWGEIIKFKIHRISDNKVRIEVLSKQATMQILDYGKNLENIEKITTYLKEQCKARNIPLRT